MKKYINVLFVLFAVLVNAVEASDPQVYHCRGSDYIYDSGIEGGVIRQVDGWRNMILRRGTWVAEIYSDTGSAMTELDFSRNTVGPYFEGFIPAYNDVFDTPIRGVVVKYTPLYNLLELKYDLEGGRRFLAFSGICS